MSQPDLQSRVDELEQELYSVMSRLKESDDSNQQMLVDVRTWKNKAFLYQQELKVSNQTLAQAELQLDNNSAEISSLRKSYRLAVKEKKDMEERLRTEMAALETTKAEFTEQQNNLLAQFMSEKKKAKDLAIQNNQVEEQLKSAVEEHSENNVPELQKNLQLYKQQLEALAVHLQNIESSRDQLISKVQDQDRRLYSYRCEVDQLNEVNRGLMEDAESYQILLQEKTLSGEFANLEIMNRREEGALGATMSAEIAQARENHPELVAKYEEKISKLEDEVKALTLYIQKILGSIMQDERLASALTSQLERERGRVSVDAHLDEDEEGYEEPAYMKHRRQKSSTSASPARLLVPKSDGSRRSSFPSISRWMSSSRSGSQLAQSHTNPEGDTDEPTTEKVPQKTDEPPTPSTPTLSTGQWLRRLSFFPAPSPPAPTATTNEAA
ncbi:uncharacterized protein BJ171DRAFT_509422 [Polychytrium aggregatum]|uniref:uncharacterized protein n=1 Tax=Polychytrium aggregatum TaxID=110093 RepID=UPI0022FE286C|nr:uncharacterized protein BJ171DRAFT_509422 [Polychytrium aggregatum]KAI9203731.1 hypothetical protein BJ171DRAFT_509422 [Polychytrium aggregatum]